MKNLIERSITGVLFVIVLVGAIMLSEAASSILFFIISFFCLWEFYNLFDSTDVRPQKKLGITAGLIFYIASVLTIRGTLSEAPLTFIIPLFFIVFIVELYRKSVHPISNIAFTFLGVIYISFPISLLYSLAYFNNETFGLVYNYQVLLGYFFILWANDTAAYFIGSRFGKRKLFPSISPKKSWEGSIGGATFGIITSVVNYFLFPNISLWIWIGIGLIVVVFGSLGDLIESLFKRRLGIKDSGKILPGHGGVLDRFDGIFISAPLVYIFLKIISLFLIAPY